MAEIMSKEGYKWLYDATRAKISSKLRKEGADIELVQRFFNEIDKKKKAGSGAIKPAAQGAFEDRVREVLDKKGITALEDVKKKAAGYAKKVKVAVRYKKGAILLELDGKKAIGVD